MIPLASTAARRRDYVRRAHPAGMVCARAPPHATVCLCVCARAPLGESVCARARVSACVCARMCACARKRVCARMRTHACLRACAHAGLSAGGHTDACRRGGQRWRPRAALWPATPANLLREMQSLPSCFSFWICSMIALISAMSTCLAMAKNQHRLLDTHDQSQDSPKTNIWQFLLCYIAQNTSAIWNYYKAF